jgi:hypothetical protein
MASSRYHAEIKSGKRRHVALAATAAKFSEMGEALQVTFFKKNCFGDILDAKHGVKPEITLTMNEDAAIALCARILRAFNYDNFYPNRVDIDDEAALVVTKEQRREIAKEQRRIRVQKLQESNAEWTAMTQEQQRAVGRSA